MTRRKKIIYWISTLWLALGMVSTGIVQLLRQKAGSGGADSVLHLGYPLYFLTILGVWKLLGVVALLIPGFALVKEWAYAGFFFVMTGALISHAVAGDPLTDMAPSLLLLVLLVISWYTRPSPRRLDSAPQDAPQTMQGSHA